MRSFFTILAALFCLPAVVSARGRGEDIADGAFLRQLQERDSVLIADQLKYGVRLNSVEEGTRLMLPDWKDTVVTGVDLVRSWTLDTVRVRKASKDRPAGYDIEAYVVLTSFEEGLHDLPGISVGRSFPDGVTDTLSFEATQLVVKTLPVDTATFVVNDLKGQVRYPVTFREVLPYLLGSLAFAGLVALLVWMLVRMRRRRAEKEAASREPAHITALRKLDRWRGEKFWEPAQQKAFYSGVTDVLREYIYARYGVSAMEMTTRELFAALADKQIPEELSGELRELFERADFVKFAKHAAEREENAAVVPFAVRFVTSTYQSDIEDEAAAAQNDKPTETGEEK